MGESEGGGGEGDAWAPDSLEEMEPRASLLVFFFLDPRFHSFLPPVPFGNGQ